MLAKGGLTEEQIAAILLNDTASTIISDATAAAIAAANAAAQQVVNSALSQASALYVGTEHNCELLRKFAVEGQTVILGGQNATQFVEGDTDTVTDAVPQWDSQQGKMVESALTMVYHPYITYYGGENDGMDWVTVDTIGTNDCAIVDNVLTLNQNASLLYIYTNTYIQLTVEENGSNVTKLYKVTAISNLKNLTLSATPTNVVSGSAVKAFRAVES